MGKSASKSDTAEGPARCVPVPPGSWIVRFSPLWNQGTLLYQHSVQHCRIFHWPCPDWIKENLFRELMIVIVQTFLAEDCERLASLIVQPQRAVEMLDQFQAFRSSSFGNDISEIEQELLTSDHGYIRFNIENGHFRYLDLLITDDFDPGYVFRDILRRNGRSADKPTSRARHSIGEVSETISSPIPGRKSPLEPTAPVDTQGNDDSMAGKDSHSSKSVTKRTGVYGFFEDDHDHNETGETEYSYDVVDNSDSNSNLISTRCKEFKRKKPGREDCLVEETRKPLRSIGDERQGSNLCSRDSAASRCAESSSRANDEQRCSNFEHSGENVGSQFAFDLAAQPGSIPQPLESPLRVTSPLLSPSTTYPLQQTPTPSVPLSHPLILDTLQPCSPPTLLTEISQSALPTLPSQQLIPLTYATQLPTLSTPPSSPLWPPTPPRVLENPVVSTPPHSPLVLSPSTFPSLTAPQVALISSSFLAPSLPTGSVNEELLSQDPLPQRLVSIHRLPSTQSGAGPLLSSHAPAGSGRTTPERKPAGLAAEGSARGKQMGSFQLDNVQPTNVLTRGDEDIARNNTEGELVYDNRDDDGDDNDDDNDDDSTDDDGKGINEGGDYAGGNDSLEYSDIGTDCNKTNTKDSMGSKPSPHNPFQHFPFHGLTRASFKGSQSGCSSNLESQSTVTIKNEGKNSTHVASTGRYVLPPLYGLSHRQFSTYTPTKHVDSAEEIQDTRRRMLKRPHVAGEELSTTSGVGDELWDGQEPNSLKRSRMEKNEEEATQNKDTGQETSSGKDSKEWQDALNEIQMPSPEIQEWHDVLGDTSTAIGEGIIAQSDHTRNSSICRDSRNTSNGEIDGLLETGVCSPVSPENVEWHDAVEY